MREKRLLSVIFFNLIIVIGEIVFGLLANSFALIADALHNGGDILAIVITYIAVKLEKRPTTFRWTFGFLRIEMMASFVNTMFLILTMFYLIYEAISKFSNVEEIEPIYMVIVGTIAIIANGLSAYLLKGISSCPHHHHDHNHHHEDDANIYSAYLHMLADALISVGVVVAGIVIYFYNIYYLDSVLTVIFSIYIIFHSYPLLKRSFLALIDANRFYLSEERLQDTILKDSRIVEYHDLHIYQPSSKHNFISFHVVLDRDDYLLKECEEIVRSLKSKLRDLGFTHILIEVDSVSNRSDEVFCSHV